VVLKDVWGSVVNGFQSRNTWASNDASSQIHTHWEGCVGSDSEGCLGFGFEWISVEEYLGQ